MEEVLLNVQNQLLITTILALFQSKNRKCSHVIVGPKLTVKSSCWVFVFLLFSPYECFGQGKS
uniref:Uncharacterized protein n=1 Tax=Setaria italica TaxID=4555 RepID=K4AHS9_SETIT